jgi:16S rRNA (guanine527-N7)-methyltransferase
MMVEGVSDELPGGLDVSRETTGRLQALLDLVEKWTPRINLVSRSTMDQAWQRHVVDSAQLWLQVSPIKGSWLDIGSGGGFPGLVIAILAQELAPELRVTLVESDQRKAVFLREATRQIGVSAHVICDRIETLAPLATDFVSARALSSLTDLLGHVDRHMRPEGVALFLKGRTVEVEIAAARLAWHFDLEEIPSHSGPDGVILKIRRVTHA